MKLKIYGSVATLGALTMVTNVSANTVATKVNGNNVLDFNVDSKKTTETSSTTQTSRRKLILYLDRSASFANPKGQSYVNTLAEKLIDSMGPNDEMAIVGSDNTDDMLIPNNVKNFIRMTTDKSALKAALNGSGDPIATLSNIVGRSVTDTELSNKSIVDIFAPGSSAKDITVVSLLDDTAISADSSSTLAGFKNFKNSGGQVLAYVPNVINSVKTMNYLSSMGVTGEYIDYNNSDANAVATKLVESVTKKTVKETKVEKEVENSTVKINIGGKNLKVKSAKLTKPDGSVENLTGEVIDKTIPNAKKGHYKVEYTFEGTINETEIITGLATVDGKEASKKVDTRKPNEETVTKRTEKIPFKTKKVEDETLLEGVEKVVVKGVEGEKEFTTTTTSATPGKEGVLSTSVNFKAKGETTTTKKKKGRSILAIFDSSGSVGSGSDSRIQNSTIPLLESMTDDDEIQIAIYGINRENSYYADGQVDKQITRMLTKAEFKKFADAYKGYGVTLNDALVKSGFKQEALVGEFEKVYDSVRDKSKTPVVMQFTDGWEYDETIDTSLADWAKKNAKTFMSVVYGGGRSVEEMKRVGYPNIFIAKDKFEQGSAQTAEVVKQIADTTTETVENKKAVANINISGKGVTVKGAKLDGEALSVKSGVVELSKELNDGDHKLEYEAVGDGTLTSNVTILGNKVGGKEDKLTSTKGNDAFSNTTERIIKEPIDEVIHVGVLGSKEEKETVDTPYDTHYEDDNESLEGVRTRKQEGVLGSKEITRVWKTIKGVKKGEPTVTEKVLKNPIDEIIKIGTLGYRFERLSNIIDSNYSFDYHDGTRYGKVIGTTLGHLGLTETTKKYKTIKGIVTGEPEVNTKVLVEKQDTDKKLGTHGKNVYTETMIEPKDVKYVNDPTLEEGKEVTAVSGQDGLKERVSTWETYKGYRRGDVQVTENVIKEKVDMVIKRGTKKKEVVQPKKEIVGSKVNEVNKGVENGLIDKVGETKAIVAPKVEVPELKKEDVKVETPKLMFGFDSFFKEINETSDLISRLVLRNVNEEKRVSDMVETDKKVTTSNELLDLIKLFINK